MLTRPRCDVKRTDLSLADNIALLDSESQLSSTGPLSGSERHQSACAGMFTHVVLSSVPR